MARVLIFYKVPESVALETLELRKKRNWKIANRQRSTESVIDFLIREGHHCLIIPVYGEPLYDEHELGRSNLEDVLYRNNIKNPNRKPLFDLAVFQLGHLSQTQANLVRELAPTLPLVVAYGNFDLVTSDKHPFSCPKPFFYWKRTKGEKALFKIIDKIVPPELSKRPSVRAGHAKRPITRRTMFANDWGP